MNESSHFGSKRRAFLTREAGLTLSRTWHTMGWNQL
jgi:hypothetical protein